MSPDQQIGDEAGRSASPDLLIPIGRATGSPVDDHGSDASIFARAEDNRRRDQAKAVPVKRQDPRPQPSREPGSQASPEARGTEGSDRPRRSRKTAAPARSATGVSTRRRARGLEARRVERVVRRIDVWSLIKVSAVFSVCLWVVMIIAGMILWQIASSLGLIHNIEKFVAELLAEETVDIDGGRLLRAACGAGAVLAVAATAFAGLLAIMFNVIATMTGGVRISVIEMETSRPVSTRP